MTQIRFRWAEMKHVFQCFLTFAVDVFLNHLFKSKWQCWLLRTHRIKDQDKSSDATSAVLIPAFFFSFFYKMTHKQGEICELPSKDTYELLQLWCGISSNRRCVRYCHHCKVHVSNSRVKLNNDAPTSPYGISGYSPSLKVALPSRFSSIMSCVGAEACWRCSQLFQMLSVIRWFGIVGHLMGGCVISLVWCLTPGLQCSREVKRLVEACTLLAETWYWRVRL